MPVSHDLNIKLRSQVRSSPTKNMLNTEVLIFKDEATLKQL